MNPALEELCDELGLRRGAPRAAGEQRWQLAELAGRLVELSGPPSTAKLSVAFSLVLEAQRAGEPVAWLGDRDTSFFPPDVAESGVDLDALVVVRLPTQPDIARAADPLVRSGAFGLIVLDLCSGQLRASKPVSIPAPLQTRLMGLAQKHGTALLCLTEKDRHRPSLGSLVSLRAEAIRSRPRVLRQPQAWVRGQAVSAADRFTCEIRMLKDKRRGPGWMHAEVFRGPAGLH